MTPGTRTKSTRERKSKLPMIGRAREDQHRQLLVALDQVVGDGAAAAEVAEPEAVVAVDQKALRSVRIGVQGRAGLRAGRLWQSRDDTAKAELTACRRKAELLACN